jgi:hypothetical protein
MNPKSENSLQKTHDLVFSNKQVEEFDAKLHDDDSHIFRQMRLKDFISKVRDQDSATQSND